MPVIDWARTDQRWPLATGGYAMRFDFIAHAAFDLFILERPGAERDYTADEVARAREYFEGADDERLAALTETVLVGLPGSEESYDLDTLRAGLRQYDGTTMLLLVSGRFRLDLTVRLHHPARAGRLHRLEPRHRPLLASRKGLRCRHRPVAVHRKLSHSPAAEGLSCRVERRLQVCLSRCRAGSWPDPTRPCAEQNWSPASMGPCRVIDSPVLP
jgi:hypothetical protein